MVTFTDNNFNGYALLCQRSRRMRAANLKAEKLALAKPKSEDLELVHSKNFQVQEKTHQDGNGRIGYFSLPGEIRNKFMLYALVPGEIHMDETLKQSSIDEESFRELLQGMNRVLGYIPGFASLPEGIPELSVPQLCAMHPGFYVYVKSTTYLILRADIAGIYLAQWLSRYALEKTPWRKITGPIINKVKPPTPA